jgi:predicted anti-sigma-YlaC factor YlaD
MFSCRQATRRTLDMLERRLTPIEHVSRWGHLFLCRHCRAHARQIRDLAVVLKRQDSSANVSSPRLSGEARARIAAALADAHHN